MIALMSPAMRMKQVSYDPTLPVTDPVFLPKTNQVAKAAQAYEMEELSKLLDVKGEAAVEYYMLWQDFPQAKGNKTPAHDKNGNPPTPAALAFNGIAYKYLDAQSFSLDAWKHAQKHLRIVSGTYGLLKPTDLVYGYRLEMRTKLPVAGAKDLYAFWDHDLVDEVEAHADGTLVLLISGEYAKSFKKYWPKDLRVIDMDFKIMTKNGYRTQSTWAKISRGTMAAMIAKEGITEPEPLKAYNAYGFEYREDMSTPTKWVFTCDAPTLEDR